MTKSTKVNAAILIIGNEILSGRTQDTNTSTLATWLNSIGVTVGEVRVIPDIEKKFFSKSFFTEAEQIPICWIDSKEIFRVAKKSGLYSDENRLKFKDLEFKVRSEIEFINKREFGAEEISTSPFSDLLKTMTKRNLN